MDPTTLGKEGYECVQVNYDTHIRYAKLDAWAKFKDFQTRISGAIVERCALDRIMIGFNGTSAAADTNITNNPCCKTWPRAGCSTSARTPKSAF